jgi:uncharacterized membrane protein (Fun14 family)
MPTWAILGLGLAVLIMIAGLAAALLPDRAAPNAAPNGATTAGALASGFAPVEGREGAASQGPTGSQWSAWGAPTFRLGFSFVVAYLAAYAVRVVFKTALLGAGFAVLMLTGLQAAGIIDVHWAVLESKGGSAASWFAEQTASVQALLTGYLPSAAAASAGFIAGLRTR